MVTLQIMNDLTVRNSLVHGLKNLRENPHLSGPQIYDILSMATHTDVCDQSVRNQKNICYFTRLMFFYFESLVWLSPTIRRLSEPKPNNYSFPEIQTHLLVG